MEAYCITRMSIGKFVKEKVTGLGAVSTFATYCGAVVALDYIYKEYVVGPTTEPIIWAISVTFGVYSFIGLLNYCWFTQSIMQDEIDRITAIKARLEAQVLKKRQSSRKK